MKQKKNMAEKSTPKEKQLLRKGIKTGIKENTQNKTTNTHYGKFTHPTKQKPHTRLSHTIKKTIQ